MLMRSHVVVPEAKDVEIVLGLGAGRQSPQTGKLLEGLEEALDATVLPGREGSAALMANAEQTEREPEERRGEGGFIVGANAPGLAEALDRLEDDAEDGDRGLGLRYEKARRAARVRRRKMIIECSIKSFRACSGVAIGVLVALFVAAPRARLAKWIVHAGSHSAAHSWRRHGCTTAEGSPLAKWVVAKPAGR